MTFTKLKQKRNRMQSSQLIIIDELAKEYDKQFEIRKRSAFIQFSTEEVPLTSTAPRVKRNNSELKLDSDIDAFIKDKSKFSNAKTQNQLDRLRKQLNIQHNVKHANHKFIKSAERLEDRELSIFRNADIDNRRTYKDVKKERNNSLNLKINFLHNLDKNNKMK